VWVNTFHHRDHLGSLRVVTDGGGWRVGEGHDYYPFGMEMVPAGTDTRGGSRKRFTGHERDEGSGLDYMLGRYYGAGHAAFLVVDPSGESANSTVPNSWHRYAYARSSPTVRIDRNGRFDTYYGNHIHETNERYLRGTLSDDAFREAIETREAIGFFLAPALPIGPLHVYKGTSVMQFIRAASLGGATAAAVNLSSDENSEAKVANTLVATFMSAVLGPFARGTISGAWVAGGSAAGSDFLLGARFDATTTSLSAASGAGAEIIANGRGGPGLTFAAIAQFVVEVLLQQSRKHDPTSGPTEQPTDREVRSKPILQRPYPPSQQGYGSLDSQINAPGRVH
jgi:RHS repeat-associated protein